jgi:hypothetical protein
MVEVLRRRATEPIVGRMSDEWLREQTARAD